ncbi:unnamed protein product [Rotaria sp. Silwood2]|nr:unnamed protein product [Rotaria sp. Silwood2]
MSMFINGLKYIVPCQSRLSSKTVEQNVSEQYQSISTTIKNYLRDHRISTADQRIKEAFHALQLILLELQSKKVPITLERSAKRENKIVQSIRSLLRNRSDIVVRRTDKSKVFYIGKATDLARKAVEYMLKTNAYQEITNDHCPLSDMLYAVKKLLTSLVAQKAITIQQFKKISPKTINLELGHYHGLPKPHKPGTPLRPIIASIHAPATIISKFLNDLLAPIYLHIAREMTFINGIDVIGKLEKYVLGGNFQATTKFVVIDMTDLYTMIPREGALHALIRFLENNSHHGKMGTLSIDAIMRMARLILDTNYFAYDNKYYRQTPGGAMGSAFTQVLANIYMHEWEQDLIQYQAAHNGIYGRYIDDIFMATNQKIAAIKIELERAAQKDINIKINYQIDTCVNFLDVTLLNINGYLKTTLYHKTTAEPYILPYTSDHPRHVHRNIPFSALLRAARFCSDVQDFNKELIRIDMSLLLSNYPPKFIKKQFNRFCQVYNAMPVLTELKSDVYTRLNQQVLYQPTQREKQLQTITQDLIRSPTALQDKIWDLNIMYP